MIKLSSIFESIESTDTKYKSDIAQQWLKSYQSEQGLIESVTYTPNEIEDRIFNEAIEFDTEAQALKFVTEIYEQLDDGFMFNEGFLGKVGTAIKNGAKAVMNKIKDFFAGPIKKAVKTFHTDIKKYKNELTGLSESLLEANGDNADPFVKAMISIIKGEKTPTLTFTIDGVGKFNFGKTIDGLGTQIKFNGASFPGFVSPTKITIKATGLKIKNVISEPLVAYLTTVLKTLQAENIEILKDKTIEISQTKDTVFEATAPKEEAPTTDGKKEVKPDETPKDDAKEEAPTTDEKAEDAPADIEDEEPEARLQKLAMYLSKGSETSLRKTGSMAKGTKAYSINTDNGIILSIGDDEKTLTPIVLFDKAMKKTVINLSAEFPKLQVPFIEQLLNTLIAEPKFKMEEIAVRLDGVKLYITAKGKELPSQLKAGKQLIIFNGVAKIKAYNPDITAIEDEEAPKGEEEAPKGEEAEATGPAEEDKVEKVREAQLKIQLDEALAKIDKGDEAFYKGLGVTKDGTWKNFQAFAKKHQYIIPEILIFSSPTATDYAPMEDNEFLCYLAHLSPLLMAIQTSFAAKPQLRTPIIYKQEAYGKFLTQSSEAARKLNQTVNTSMKMEDNAKTAPKAGAKATEKEVKEPTYDELMASNPELIKAIQKNVKSKKAMSDYTKKLSEMKNKIDLNKLTPIVSQTGFFNDRNSVAKIDFVSELYAVKATDEEVKTILLNIVNHGIEDNFTAIDQFKDAKTALDFLRSGADLNALKSDIFDKSKF